MGAFLTFGRQLSSRVGASTVCLNSSLA